MKHFHFILKYLLRHRTALAGAVAATVATNLMAVLLPGFIRHGVDAIARGVPDPAGFYRALRIMAVLAGVMGVTRILSRVLFFNSARDIERRMKRDLLEKLMTLGKGYYDLNPSGAIISRINNDITGVRLLCGFALLQAVSLACSFTLTPAMMWRLSPSLTLACAALITVVFTIYRAGMKEVRRRSRQQMHLLRQVSMFAAAALSAIETIKNFTIGSWARRRFRGHGRQWLDNGITLSFWNVSLGTLFSNLDLAMKILVLGAGGTMVARGTMTLGQLTAFLAYTSLLMAPLGGLNWMLNMLQQSFLGLESLQTILNEQPEPRRTAEPVKGEASAGLEVRGLRYTYPRSGREVLREVSFCVRPGQVVGILGCIGSGKTTLVNCLNGYLPLEPGFVFLDGADITALPLAAVRERITTVTQEPFLFSETVEDNVGFLPGAGLQSDALWALLEDTAMADEVRGFPAREKTLVGERGIMLSGGQKQRLSLARALARPASILILDNVFSAVDYETERKLLEAVYRKKPGHGLLIISHRVRALEKADMILVLEDGRIADRGTHRELVARPGYYRDTWLLQHSMTPGSVKGVEP